MNPVSPAGIGSMETSTATDDECCVNLSGERRSVQEWATQTLDSLNAVDLWPTPTIECEIGHKFASSPVTWSTFDFRLHGICSSKLVYKAPGSRKRLVVDRVQSIKVWALAEQAARRSFVRQVGCEVDGRAHAFGRDCYFLKV